MKLSEDDARRVADKLNYSYSGHVIAVAQDADNNEVLMVALMDREAVIKTLTTGLVHYKSRKRGIWQKGEKSGNVQQLVDFLVDCDEDSVVLRVKQAGGACHRGYKTCFYRRLVGDDFKEILERLFDPRRVYKDL